DRPEVVDDTYGTATLEAFARTLESGASTTRAPARSERSDTHPLDAASSTRDDAGNDVIRVEVNDRLFRVRVVDLPQKSGRTNGAVRRQAPRLGGAARSKTASGNAVLSPMHGIIVELGVAEGQAVEEGQVVAVIEAMKMMNEIRAERRGTVARIHGSVGDAVEAGSPLVTLT